MKRIVFAALIAVCFQAAAQVPDFTLTNTITGKPVSLADYKTSPGVVIIFTSNACPYDDYYAGRVKKLIQDFNGKVPFILVNANPGANEAAEPMKAKGTKINAAVPYLADKGQVLMKNLGATKSPEVFVLKNNGKQFAVFYRGAIDDNAQVEADVHQPYLANALNALLAGQKPEAAEVRPVGCAIHKITAAASGSAPQK